MKLSAAWVLALLPLASLAGTNSFTSVGPHGGATPWVAAQPGHANVLLAGSSRGVYRSSDAGDSWTLVFPQLRGSLSGLAFDPSQPTRAFVLGTQVWRTADSGLTWTQVSNFTDPVEKMSVSGSRVYVASVYGTIYRSDDAGTSWNPVFVPWSTATDAYRLYAFTTAPGNSAVIMVCIAGQGTFRSDDGGQSWAGPFAASPCSGQSNWAFDLAISPADPDRVLAPTADGLLLSTNGGSTWNTVFAPPFVQAAVFDPLAPSNVLGLDSLGLVMRSFDGGATWPGASNGANLRVYNLLGGTFTGAAPGEFYAATSNGPMYSADNGATFASRFNGIHASDARELIAADDGTVYAMFYSGPAGIHRRVNGVWTSADNDELVASFGGPLNVMDIATSAQDSSLLFYADQGMGFWRSQNGGDDWSRITSQIGTQIFVVDVDPTNANVVYAAPAQGGLRRSTDGGLTYSNCGLSSSIPLAHVYIDRASPNILYAIGAYGAYATHVYKSMNSCASWIEVATRTGGQFNAYSDLAIDPADHNRLYATHLMGVDVSINGGGDWTPMAFDFGSTGVVFGTRLLVDPVETSTLWVLSSDQPGFARSVDGGATWQKGVYPVVGNGVWFRNAVLVPTSPDTLVAGAPGLGLVEYQVALDLEAGLTLPTEGLFADAQFDTTVSVRNLGLMDSSAARVTVSLPAFLSPVSIPSGCTLAGSTLTCRVTRLRAGQTTSVALRLAAAAAAASGNVSVSVQGHEADPVANNNTASGNLQTRRQVDLMVSAPGNSTLARTASANLDFTVQNQGPSNASDVRLTFDVPVGLQATAATLAGGSCVVAAQTVACNLPSLATNASAAARISITGGTAGTYSIGAHAVSDGVDPDLDQDTFVQVVVIPSADLSVELGTPNTSRDIGVQFVYTATIRNAGPDVSQPTTDFAVTAATVATATSAAGTCAVNGGSVHCQLNDLASNASATVLLTMSASAAGTATVQADVSWTGFDSSAANNHASSSVTITTPAPMPSSSGGNGGGGGGGGRFDWLLLALLGLFAGRRWMVARRAFARS